MFKNKEEFMAFYESSGSRVDQDYQRIKANITFAANKNNLKIFTVLSPNEKDGKTNFLTYIGLTFCKEEKRVLLIDGDFKKPGLHKSFHLSNEQGLSNYLTGESSLTDCIQRTSYPGLSILPAGTISKQLESIIHSSQMNALITALRHSYDYVFIDTEAMKESTAAKILAAKADSSIVIIRKKKTNTEDLMNMRTAFKSYGIHITGAVFNTRKLAWLQK
ncbi:CpsD/CapB family tyrosine-protein kinase [Alkalicoccus daliensis]|uniref:non-specific protein-tyrosine kinase n=1 Tax=Alkalicoccus daliensis TaxID=745820 RepID=A0A1G9ZKY2_9BACI|nr:CpsD/CapB family tyrosine-protein kinase [Alkalicoccus daliensis]SDN21641.1 capsular exopolysaccharide family [Alkalicoccus daliensis]